jgi:hypothetical protein
MKSVTFLKAMGKENEDKILQGKMMKMRLKDETI